MTTPSDVGTAMAAVRLLSRGNDPAPWRALLARITRWKAIQSAASAYAAHDLRDTPRDGEWFEARAELMRELRRALTTTTDEEAA